MSLLSGSKVKNVYRLKNFDKMSELSDCFSEYIKKIPEGTSKKLQKKLQLDLAKERKNSCYKEWSVDFNGKTIKVSNWWEGNSFILDNEHLDQNTDM